MKFRTLLAVLALAISGAAQAGLIADGQSKVSGGSPAGSGPTANVTNGGDLFLAVHDDVTNDTYIQNLNLDMVAFKNAPASTSVPVEADGQTFLTKPGSTFSWAVFAANTQRGVVATRLGVTNYGNVADWGFLTTISPGGAASNFVNGLDNNINEAINKVGIYINAVNSFYLTPSINGVVVPGTDNTGSNFSVMGNNLANSSVYGNNGSNGALTDTLDFYFVSNDALHTTGGGPVAQLLGTWQLSSSALAFSATSTTQPNPHLSPSSIDFGSVEVGVTSSVQQVTLSNSGGTAAYTIGAIALNGDADFQIANTSTCVAGNSLAIDATCTIDLAFTPASANPRSSALTVGSLTAIALSGTGLATATPNPARTPDSLNFSNVTVGTTSAVQSVTVSNTGGTAAYTIGAIGLTGNTDFQIANSGTCQAGNSLAINATCTIDITFTPASTGSRAGSLTIGSLTAVTLAGTGTSASAPNPARTPDNLAFGSVAVGTTSPVQTVTVSNTGGTAAYTIGAIALTGDSDFQIANSGTCVAGASLAIDANCTIDITFTPASAAARTGSLTIGSLNAVALSGTGTDGTGTAIAVLSDPTEFGQITVGADSAVQTLTLQNNGTAAYDIKAIVATGDFRIASSSTCPLTVGPLAASASCTIDLVFAPTAVGPRSGSLTVQPTSGSDIVKSLTGTGQNGGHLSVSLTDTDDTTGAFELNFGSVAQNKRARLPVIVTNDGTATVTITSITDPDAPFSVTEGSCTKKPLKAGKSCTAIYTFAPTEQNSFTGTSTIKATGLDDIAIKLTGTTGPAGPLSVLSIEPSDIALGGQFTLFGSDFTSTRNGKVLVGNKTARLAAPWTDTSISVRAPRLAANTYDVLVRRNGNEDFTKVGEIVVHAPEVIAFNNGSTSLTKGSTFTIAGKFFGNRKDLKVLFKPVEGGRTLIAKPLAGSSDSELSVIAPNRLISGKSYKVQVVNFAGSSSESSSLTIE